MCQTLATKIGIEVHVPLNTKFKMFSPQLKPPQRWKDSSQPQKYVDHLDLAELGILPRINKEVLTFGIKIASLLNCEISKFCTFERKHYFYPDNPHGYQITQKNNPIGKNGKFDYLIWNKDKVIDLHTAHIKQIQLENDTAKHQKIQGDYFFLDFSRHNVPLAEIITTPCFDSSIQVISFLKHLSNVLEGNHIYVKDSDSSMRIDINLNLENDSNSTSIDEIKNLLTKHSVKLAIEQLFEIKRSEFEANSSNNERKTYSFDDKTNKLVFMRPKTSEYIYTDEFNIPPIRFSDSNIENIMSSLKHCEISYHIQEISKVFPKVDINCCYLINKSCNKYKLIELLHDYKDYFEDSKKMKFIIRQIDKSLFSIDSTTDAGTGNVNMNFYPKLLKNIFMMVFNYQIDAPDFQAAFNLIWISENSNESDYIEIMKSNNLYTICDEDMINRAIDNFLSINPRKYQKWLDENRIKLIVKTINKWVSEQTVTYAGLKFNESKLKDLIVLRANSKD